MHVEGSARLGIVISMFPELHETFILRELAALERKGVNFQIYSLQLPRDPLRLSKTITRLVANSYDRPMDIIKALAILPVTLHFGEHARASGISHLHGHWANIPTTACWMLQQIYDFSWSAAIHGEDIFSANRFLPYKLDDAAFSVVCSGYFCNHLQTRLGLQTPRQVHLNYHGLDPRVMQLAEKLERHQRSPGEALNLVSIGRLVPTKGHDTLLHACAGLRDTHGVDFKLQLIGSGPDEESLKSLCTSLNLEQQVEFCGGIAFDDVLDRLGAADAFCLAPRLIHNNTGQCYSGAC